MPCLLTLGRETVKWERHRAATEPLTSLWYFSYLAKAIHDRHRSVGHKPCVSSGSLLHACTKARDSYQISRYNQITSHMLLGLFLLCLYLAVLGLKNRTLSAHCSLLTRSLTSTTHTHTLAILLTLGVALAVWLCFGPWALWFVMRLAPAGWLSTLLMVNGSLCLLLALLSWAAIAHELAILQWRAIYAIYLYIIYIAILGSLRVHGIIHTGCA